MDGETRGAVRVARVACRTGVALLSAVVLATTGYGWTVAGEFGEQIATSDAVAGPAVPLGAEAPFTALLVGLDSRTDTSGAPLPPDVLDELNAGGDEGQLNTDTIILLHVPRGPRPNAVAISFPRDSYVSIAGGRGMHKINTAYARGRADAEDGLDGRDLLPAERERIGREAGRRALVATVAQLAGVTVDRFAEINLAGFVEITDALGGVPVCLNAAVRETRSGIDLPAGRQLVRGAEALAFVRQRRGLDDGDLDRIGRQQAFLAGLTSTIASSGTLRDPARLDRLARAAGRYVVLDRGWDVGGLVGQLQRVAAGDLTFVTIPTGSPALETRDDGIAVEVDPDEVRRFVRAQIPGLPAAPAAAPSSGRVRGPATTAAPTPGPSASPAPTTRPSPSATAAGRRSTGPTSTSRGPSATPASPTATAPPITADGVPCVD